MKKKNRLRVAGKILPNRCKIQKSPGAKISKFICNDYWDLLLVCVKPHI